MANLKRASRALGLLMCAALVIGPAYSENGSSPPDEAPPTQPRTAPMTNDRLGELIQRIDEDAEGRPGLWQFSVEERPVTVITDAGADRMRILTPVADSEKLDAERLRRLLQANFDTALDARYAIAQGVLWGSFIHPLSPLTDQEFLSGLGQVINLAATYGDSYSSGALVFGGGDSAERRRRELIDELLDKGLAI